MRVGFAYSEKFGVKAPLLPLLFVITTKVSTENARRGVIERHK